MLPELLPLASLLAAEPEWERDAAGVAALLLGALRLVAASYQRQGDATSAAIVLEAGLRRWVMGVYSKRGGFLASVCVLTTVVASSCPLPLCCHHRYEELAGVRHPAVKATMRAADAALDTLTPDQRSAVAAARPRAEETIARVAAALTDELAAYQPGNPVSKLQLWDAEGTALIGPLH